MQSAVVHVPRDIQTSLEGDKSPLELLSYGPEGTEVGVEMPIGLVFNKYVYPGEGTVEFRDCGIDGLCNMSIRDDGVWDLPIRGDYRTPFGVQRWHSNYNFLWKFKENI